MLKKSYEAFKVTIENKVAHIQMSRPEAMNTMNKAFWNELPEIVRTIDTEALARVIVISSTASTFPPAWAPRQRARHCRSRCQKAGLLRPGDRRRQHTDEGGKHLQACG